MIFFNLPLIAFLAWPMCRESWRDKESHTMRRLPLPCCRLSRLLHGADCHGLFLILRRVFRRWIETVYLVIIWNLLYQMVLRGLA
ncbi:hypothetical protein ACLK1S_02930 [Escherichia coli]